MSCRFHRFNHAGSAILIAPAEIRRNPASMNTRSCRCYRIRSRCRKTAPDNRRSPLSGDFAEFSLNDSSLAGSARKSRHTARVNAGWNHICPAWRSSQASSWRTANSELSARPGRGFGCGSIGARFFYRPTGADAAEIANQDRAVANDGDASEEVFQGFLGQPGPPPNCRRRRWPKSCLWNSPRRLACLGPQWRR